MVLVSYQDLIRISQPFLYAQESVNFHYGDINKLKTDNSRHVSEIEVNNSNFVEPLEVTMVHTVSDAVRNQDLMRSKQQLLNIIIATLIVTLCFAIVASRWLTQPIRKMERVVRSFKTTSVRIFNPSSSSLKSLGS